MGQCLLACTCKGIIGQHASFPRSRKEERSLDGRKCIGRDVTQSGWYHNNILGVDIVPVTIEITVHSTHMMKIEFGESDYKNKQILRFFLILTSGVDLWWWIL